MLRNLGLCKQHASKLCALNRLSMVVVLRNSQGMLTQAIPESSPNVENVFCLLNLPKYCVILLSHRSISAFSSRLK